MHGAPTAVVQPAHAPKDFSSSTKVGSGPALGLALINYRYLVLVPNKVLFQDRPRIEFCKVSIPQKPRYSVVNLWLSLGLKLSLVYRCAHSASDPIAAALNLQPMTALLIVKDPR